MNTQTVIFAGGCFWCTEHDLKETIGVIDVVSGYSGGTTENPDYYNHGNHRESVLVTYDAAQTNFKKLCQFFLDHIDPTDSDGQFYDRGESYKTAIYYKNDTEKIIAESLLTELQESGLYPGEKIAVQVLPETKFYKAEDYHQNYAAKNTMHYENYAKGSGRVTFVANTCAVREQKKINWKD